jgi:Lrp/AsnC family leucine-responsive transcriptional regulator
MIDDIDVQILDILQANARTTNADIARAVDMAPSAVLERIRKLEERGVIAGYTAKLNPAVLGRTVLAFILVRSKTGCWEQTTADQLAAVPEIQEVHHIAGEDCFLVKVRVRDTAELAALLRTRFEGIGTIGSTRTTIVLESVKETMALPVRDANSERAAPTNGRQRGGRHERAKIG